MKTDDSLFFMICMAKQLEKYAKDKFSSEPFPEGLFVLAELVDQVPDEDYISGYADAIGIEYSKPGLQTDQEIRIIDFRERNQLSSNVCNENKTAFTNRLGERPDDVRVLLTCLRKRLPEPSLLLSIA